MRFHRFFGESHTGVVARELRDGLVNTLIQQIFVAFKPMPHVIRTVEFQRPTVGTILFEQKIRADIMQQTTDHHQMLVDQPWRNGSARKPVR